MHLFGTTSPAVCVLRSETQALADVGKARRQHSQHRSTAQLSAALRSFVCLWRADIASGHGLRVHKRHRLHHAALTHGEPAAQSSGQPQPCACLLQQMHRRPGHCCGLSTWALLRCLVQATYLASGSILESRLPVQVSSCQLWAASWKWRRGRSCQCGSVPTTLPTLKS